MKKKTCKIISIIIIITTILSVTTVLALADPADNDAVNAVKNLSSFFFTIFKAVGGLMIAYGILQVGMSLQAHDPSQRTQGILVLLGGILIAFAETIVNVVTG